MTSQQRPWLSCSLASRTTVFMVGICNAASNLRRLALPSEDLYIDMEYFKFTSMNDLVNNVIAKTCDCATQCCMSTASTASETSVIETESSITSATSSGYTTVTSTTSAASAKPSSTPDAETPTSDLTVPSTTTTTDAKS
uniref:Uncharacterized protein n=1 Tax=Parascaris univalens TaxID=6257 RepID=A0A915CH62_PARUN